MFLWNCLLLSESAFFLQTCREQYWLLYRGRENIHQTLCTPWFQLLGIYRWITYVSGAHFFYANSCFSSSLKLNTVNITATKTQKASNVKWNAHGDVWIQQIRPGFLREERGCTAHSHLLSFIKNVNTNLFSILKACGRKRGRVRLSRWEEKNIICAVIAKISNNRQIFFPPSCSCKQCITIEMASSLHTRGPK